MSIIDYQNDGLFQPERIAAALQTTRNEITRTVGLGRDAISRHECVGSARTQRRLREMLEIVNLMEPRLGSAAL